MSKRFRKLTALTSAAALAFTLSACSKGGTSSQGNVADGKQEVTMWTHNAGNEEELAAIEQIVADYNAQSDKYQVTMQAFPQASYNQSVVAAASSNSLPCIMDIDGPNVPNWAWAGYLAPFEGMDDTLNKFLPTTVGRYEDKIYSYGYYDVALSIITRKSILDEFGIRTPTVDQPWTREEFTDALAKVKASGKYAVPFDINTADQGEWYPYAYSPYLQSFGGDLIDRSKFESAEGALNGPEALEWAKWMRSLVTEGYTPANAGSDPTQDFINGKSAFLWMGSWAAQPTEEAFGDDVVFLPPPDFGKGPKIGGGSWQWGMSPSCPAPEGALDYMKFAAQDKYVASVSVATRNIPATDAATAEVPAFAEGGKYSIFREFSKKYAVLRPETAGYPFIATEFTKATQDILNGGDPEKILDQTVANIDANQKANGFFK